MGFVGDEFAVGVFVVGEAVWAECGVHLYEGDVGAFGEALDEWYVDVGVISTIDCEPPAPVQEVAAWTVNESLYIIKRPEKAYVGMYECHMGRTSEIQCGNVTYANVTTSINYSNDGRGIIALHHTDQVCALSQSGDSGGPWVIGNSPHPTYGYGTAINVAGNEHTCGSGGVAIGYELSYALEAVGVYLSSE